MFCCSTTAAAAGAVAKADAAAAAGCAAFPPEIRVTALPAAEVGGAGRGRIRTLDVTTSAVLVLFGRMLTLWTRPPLQKKRAL